MKDDLNETGGSLKGDARKGGEKKKRGGNELLKGKGGEGERM